MNITDFNLVEKLVDDGLQQYKSYDIEIPLDHNLIESICGGQLTLPYKRITSCGNYVNLTDEEIERKLISIKKLIDLKVNTVLIKK